jgi:hypothetical protein
MTADDRLRRLAGWLPRLESAEGREFVAALPVEPFAWPAWLETDEGRRLSHDPAAFESGLLTAIVRRARELSAGD